jgi:hypothetical protein
LQSEWYLEHIRAENLHRQENKDTPNASNMPTIIPCLPNAIPRASLA